MEDTKSLLIMVLHKIFHDRPKIVENTYQKIYNYNNGKKEKNEYEKTLKNICDLMNDELPSEILVYLLTLVDMPQEDGNQLPIMEKIQKTYGCLAESVRPFLLEFLSQKRSNEKNILFSQKEDLKKGETKVAETEQKPEIIKEMSTPSELKSENISIKSSVSEQKFLKPTLKRTRNKKKIAKHMSELSDDNEPLKSLLDISANYVIGNEINLKLMYKSKLTQAWKMIKSDTIKGDDLKQCYNVVKDLNKKVKLLRCIENDNITEDILMEEYGNSEIFLKYYTYVPEKDPFEISDELSTALRNFIGN